MAWLDALVENGANCLEDSYAHLVQFFDDNKKTLGVISKIAIAEKIVAFSLILTQKNIEKIECNSLIPSNILKHLHTKKSEKGYIIEMHQDYQKTEAEIAEIIKSCFSIIQKLIEDTEFTYSTNIRKFSYDAIQIMLFTWFLNARNKSEIWQLNSQVQKLINVGFLKLSN